MPADIESMVYSASETPWHGLGTPIDDTVSFWEAFEKANLNWNVFTEPTYRKDGTLLRQRVAIRDTDQAELGSVGPRWTPLQNKDAFKVFEPLVEDGTISLETAGSLKGGKRVWVLCKINLDNSEIVKGDEVAKYSLLSNGHDGILGVHFGFTPIRVVCTNTESMARNSKASKLIRVRHHKFVQQNVEKLREVMDFANQEFEATAEQYRHLASRGINQSDLQKYLKIVFKLDKKEKDEISTRSKNILGRVEDLFESGKGTDIPGVKGTYWGAYNAVTEYLNYEKGRTAENRMDSLWYGQNRDMSELALETALTLAG